MPRSKLDDIVEDVRARAGADFAFVLTRRGRLITSDAPPDMPEPGRMRLVRAARPILGSSQTLQVTLARQELVPYGGAAPVDVYIAVVREQAIVCVVMSTWGDKRPIIPAIQGGIADMEPVLDRRSESAPPPKARGSERGRSAGGTSRPPPRTSAPAGKSRRRGAMSGLVGLMGGVATPSRALEQSPVIQNARTPPPPAPEGSIPDIVVGEGALGRESLEAIERELQGSMPEILLGEGRLGAASLAAIEAASRLPVSSSPDVRLELASISRGSIAEIARTEAELAEREMLRPDPAIPPTSRLTNPWSEAAIDSQRVVDAQRRVRAIQPPRVSLKLESLDEEVIEAALVEELETHVAARLTAPASPQKSATPQKPPAPTPPRPAPRVGPPPLPQTPKAGPPPLPPLDDAPDIEVDGTRPPQSSYEVWADAVEEVTGEHTLPTKKTKRR